MQATAQPAAKNTAGFASLAAPAQPAAKNTAGFASLAAPAQKSTIIEAELVPD